MRPLDKDRLRNAIVDFGKLADGAQPSKILEAHRQLFEAQMFSSDGANDEEALSDIIAKADGVADLYSNGRESDVIAVRLLVAQARQQRADLGHEGDKIRKDLRAAREDFNAVLAMLADRQRDRRWAECKDGLATTLQQLGELEFGKGDDVANQEASANLQEAVEHLREVLLLNLGVRSPDQAGRLRNLAASIAARAKMDPDTRLSLQDAQTHLEQAIDIYRTQDGAADDVKQTEKELGDLRSLLAT